MRKHEFLALNFSLKFQTNFIVMYFIHTAFILGYNKSCHSGDKCPRTAAIDREPFTTVACLKVPICPCPYMYVYTHQI